MNLLSLKSVVRVGSGRGFVIEGRWDRLVITAAHCLPSFPPCISFAGASERTYFDLLAPLGGEPSVAAECLFVDPIGDIAVLGTPDSNELSAQYEAYDSMLSELDAVEIGSMQREIDRAWLLSLDNQWFRCAVKRRPGEALWIENATKGIRAGMSGSPIMTESGEAIGVVVTSSSTGDQEIDTKGGPNPYLTGNLPGWIFATHEQW